MFDKFVKLYNGVKMPILGFGTDYLSGDMAYEAVISAIKAGYRAIDTAAIYKNENDIGRAIKKCIDDGIVKREELFIITKSHWFFPGYEETLNSFEQSLKKLGLDYIDLFLLHHPFCEWPSWRKDIAYSWRAMEELYNNKKTRAIGISNFRWPYFDVVFNSGKILPMVHQVELHPQYKNKEAVEPCLERNIKIMAWSPLNKGKVLEDKTVKSLALKYSKTPAQIALRWNIQSGNALVVKSCNIDRINSNYQIWNFELSDEDMKKLNSIKPCYNGIRLDEAVLVGDLSKSRYFSILENYINRTYSKNFKLFGVIPFFKIIRKNANEVVYYLFNIPICKTEIKYYNQAIWSENG